MSWFSMNLEGNQECIYTSDLSLKMCKMGSLLVSFLDVDWEAYENEIASLRNDHGEMQNRTKAFVEFYHRARKEISAHHPLLADFAGEQLWGAMRTVAGITNFAAIDFVDALKKGNSPAEADEELLRNFLREFATRFHSFAEFKHIIEALMDSVLDAGAEPVNLTPSQKYALMRQNDMTYLTLANELYKLIRIESLLFLNGKKMEDLYHPDGLPEEIQKSKITARVFQTGDFLQAMLLWEFDYMAAHNLPLRRCSYCRRYFIPHSTVSRYCDRPTAENPAKTCKDIGSTQKYQAAVNSDKARNLYRKVNNRVQTWASRHLEQYPNCRKVNYPNWQFHARKLLEQVLAGTLDYDAFAKEIDGKPKELLGL